jgi:hypothetical protein
LRVVPTKGRIKGQKDEKANTDISSFNVRILPGLYRGRRSRSKNVKYESCE